MKRAAAAVVALPLLIGQGAASAQPYASDLERLSEIMGALQFLSELCDVADVDWHAQMETLLDAAAGDDEERLRMTDRYNLGYSGFAVTYRECTPAAEAAIARYRVMGAALVAGVADAFPEPGPAIEPGG